MDKSVSYKDKLFKVRAIANSDTLPYIQIQCKIDTSLKLTIRAKEWLGSFVETFLARVCLMLKITTPLKISDPFFENYLSLYSSTAEEALKYLEQDTVKQAIQNIFLRGYSYIWIN